MRKRSKKESEGFIEIEVEVDGIDKYIPRTLDDKVTGKLKELSRDDFDVYIRIVEEARERIDYHTKHNYFWFKKHNLNLDNEGIALLKIAYAIAVKGGYIKR